MLEDDPNERPTLPAPNPFSAIAYESEPWFTSDAREVADAETRWWLDSRRRWLARWVFAVVGMAAVVLCAALTMKLLL